MRRRDPRKPSEYQIQAAVMDYIRLNKAPYVIAMHVPNQQASGPRRGAFLKRMGVLPGAADIVLFRAWTYRDPLAKETLWLELKSAGKQPTVLQRAFRDAVTTIGHDWHCTASVDDAITLLKRGGWTR